MTFRLALRTLVQRPLRSLVLAGGFGLGIAVMASLLGIGQVILEQAQAPALQGGGDVVVSGPGGRLTSARFVMQQILEGPALGDRTVAVSPTRRASVYLVGRGGVRPIEARGGVPSLEQALGDAETGGRPDWTDSRSDLRWTTPDPGEVLRAMDRFHPIPDSPRFAGSWAEWLYFNGRSGTTGFYLTFLAGPESADGLRTAGVRLQLDRDGVRSSWGAIDEVDGASLLASAPTMEIGGNRVALVGLDYVIRLDLRDALDRRLEGELTLRAIPGRSFAPIEIRGADGWLTGYTVPVLSGPLDGRLEVDGRQLSLDGGSGYHDHNWGFWKDVTWNWGQVRTEGLSLVYGRVFPPADVIDLERMPGVLVALGDDGPLGYALDVRIDEGPDRGDDAPESILVTGRGATMRLTLALEIGEVLRTRLEGSPLSVGRPFDLLQLDATYSVSGSIDGKPVAFEAAGSAETFRGR